MHLLQPLNHFSLLTFYFVEFFSVYFRVLPWPLQVFYFFIFSCIQWIPWPLLVFTSHFLLFTFSMPLKAPASSPNNEYQYRPAEKHGP